MIKTIIFDSDGVITTSKLFSEDLEKEHGIKAEKLIPFFKSIFQKCLTDEADLKEELKNYIEDWGWKGTIDELTDFWFNSGHEIDDQVMTKIKELQDKGIKCYVATNQEKYRTEYMRKEMGFADIFEEVWSSADVGLMKPNEDFFENIFEKINKVEKTKKDEVLFFDDDIDNVQGAKNFGIDSHLYTDFDEFEKIIDEKIK
jgi:putative hydrolase of the HAD superfamily